MQYPANEKDRTILLESEEGEREERKEYREVAYDQKERGRAPSALWSTSFSRTSTRLMVVGGTLVQTIFSAFYIYPGWISSHALFPMVSPLPPAMPSHRAILSFFHSTSTISSTALADLRFRPPYDVTLNRLPFYNSIFLDRCWMAQLRDLGLVTIRSVLRAGRFCGYIGCDNWDMFGPDSMCLTVCAVSLFSSDPGIGKPRWRAMESHSCDLEARVYATGSKPRISGTISFGVCAPSRRLFISESSSSETFESGVARAL
ncbi:hypothetical protein K438DRAFT_435281 [Mycena galopus ATCC 62051]|nr:hypothetical protein K438DRAFT_435281 [Mycena galopus ATCC 62051]